MSLFKTRDWWSVPVESDTSDECDSGHLIVGNIANLNPPVNNIITGGYSGSLKIYAPQSYYNEEEEKELFGYRPDHLVLEVALGIPILHLAIGKFVSGNSNLHLCVLHQDHLVIYTVSLISGQTGHGSQAKLNKAYQHNFQRKAYSITIGNFGSVKGKDFLAVQSLDGCITFYEQESLGFVCFLPGFLLPGPLVYLPKSDTLVTQASDWSLQSYTYQTLSILIQEGAKPTNVKMGGKRIQPEWTQILSEWALDIKILVEPGNVSSVLILTTRAFMCYKDSGVLKFIKKLEYNPMCFTAYHHEKSIHICIASNTRNLLLYQESELKWASQLPFNPVAIERSNFKGIKGALVLLGEEGELQVCYMGADPSLFVAPPHETREINYELTDKEMSRLNKIIRSSTKDIGNLMNLSNRDKDLVVTAAVGNQLEAWIGPTKVNDPDGIPSIPVVIRLTTHTPLKAVRVNVLIEKPIAVTQDTFVMSTICDNCQIIVKFYLAEQYVPSSLESTIVTSYISVNGAPYVTRTLISLPLKLVAKPSAPNKEADHKITISTNKPAVNLPDIFTEFGLDSSVSTALGLQFYGGANVTLLSSKTTNRYRLQSDSLSSIWVIFHSMKERLEKYWEKEGSKDSEEKLNLIVTSALPVQELFSEIDAHFLRRKKLKELENQLVNRAMQFRAVQRRLLTKFKDKTPTPLTNFDNLLDGTYKQIIQLTDAVDNLMQGLQEDACQLSCVLRLVIELLCIQAALEAPQKELILATLSPVFYHNIEQGWEEVVDSSLMFILRTILAKGNRDTGNFSQILTMPSDTNKLKKHINLFIERIMKGGFSSQSEFRNKLQESKSVESSIPEERDSSENDDLVMGDSSYLPKDETEVPLGSKLGEDRARSARVKSARIQSARSARLFSRQESEEVDVFPEEETVTETNEDDVEENAESEEKTDPLYLNNSDNIYNEKENNYETIPEEKIVDNNEPIYEEIPDDLLPRDTKVEENSTEILKRATSSRDTLIEAPRDIFGNPVDDDNW